MTVFSFSSLPDQAETKIIPCPITGCWLWTGFLTRGYGRIRVRGKMFLAHRYVYQQLKSAIPPGLDLDHACRVPACVNPAHLEAVPHHVNVLRGKLGETAKARMLAKTCCPNGHTYDVNNIRWTTVKGKPVRRCLICLKRSYAESHRRRRLKKEACVRINQKVDSREGRSLCRA